MGNLILGKRPPLIREVAGMIFGIVFVLSEGYSGLEFILALIASPLLFAGIIRLVVIFYRIVTLFLYAPVLCAILALIGFGFVINAVIKILSLSEVLGLIVICALVIAEAWFFIRDMKNAIRTHCEGIVNGHD